MNGFLQISSIVTLLILGAGALAGPNARPAKIQTAPSQQTFRDDVLAATGLHLSEISNQETALILDMPREAPVEVSVLDEPRRLVLDLPKVAFPARQDGIRTSGPVKAFRYGWFIAGRSRIILDLDGPAVVDRIDPVTIDNGSRMVITIKRTTPEQFALAVRETSAVVRYTGTVKNGTLAQVTTPEGKQGLPRPPADALPLVVIDPGHGGIDPGATGPHGESEKQLVLAIGQMLKTKLEASGKLRVEMTRDSDIFVPLSERVRIGRTKSAALFISLHADTLNDEPGVRGATVYTLSDKASDAGAAQLADKENKVDQLAGIDASEDKETVSDILFDLARRETRVFSLSFAKILIAQLQGVPANVNKNPHRFAGFRVLKAPDVPSVLLELGYLSSAEDARQLASPEWQDKLTSSAADAVTRFVTTRVSGK